MQSVQQKQRRYDRQDHRAAIQFSRYNTNRYHHGRLKNIGEGGLCFESQTALRPGESVFIRIVPITVDSTQTATPPNPNGLRAFTMGEVKWCLELSESETYTYGIGIQYFAPVY